ncbi:MAG: mandelate racemase/muconate lactonizing enzyme family protein [Bryobacterales bacterium]|nr:mandelate racemase/muconate lactonizing enzyme family protein [Bryobacterales bacterium]
MHCFDDVRAFDAMLKRRVGMFREKLADLLAPHRLTLDEARVHKVLVPMVGVYTPGWQALPAVSWAFVEVRTKEGLVGTGEWSVDLDRRAAECIAALRAQPGRNLLDPSLEEPLFMAWWDLVGQILGKPLHRLWAEIFETPYEPRDLVPMAAYTWQRFPDIDGNDAITYETWHEFAADRAREGFPAVKVSMTAYQPEDHVRLVHRIREAVGPDTAIRIDAHGTWNYQEARRILNALEGCDLEYAEQPVHSLLPQRFYPASEKPPVRRAGQGSYQAEYYYRRMTALRQELRTPLSCHWWPPILHPPGASPMANEWEPDWYMLERYEGADVAVPDINLGPWGLWRFGQLAKFMGLHTAVHSNFELCTQLAFRAAMTSALLQDPERVGIYMGRAPRTCHPIDNETIHVRDDVIEGGQFDWAGGHLRLPDSPGHGLRLDPERLEKYRYCEEAVAPHREHARRIYANYMLDRPRRTTLSGWPKLGAAERFDRHAWPYEVAGILGSEEGQDIDVELTGDQSG